MELPDDVLSLIKEFSHPITRPDWRTLHKMTYKRFYQELRQFQFWHTDRGGIIRIKQIYLILTNPGFILDIEYL